MIENKNSKGDFPDNKCPHCGGKLEFIKTVDEVEKINIYKCQNCEVSISV